MLQSFNLDIGSFSLIFSPSLTPNHFQRILFLFVKQLNIEIWNMYYSSIKNAPNWRDERECCAHNRKFSEGRIFVSVGALLVAVCHKNLIRSQFCSCMYEQIIKDTKR